ncbi:MAG: radical SAM protein [Candidatus Riflebacteria bacterium]|nr:radical SAM protein [Candidatus Riflebacteria bacterium]
MSHPADRYRAELLALERGPFPFRENGPFRVCLVYPNSYRVGMSNLGFQAVYRAINDTPGMTCERTFLPEAAQLRDLERYRLPLFSLESGRELSDFEVVAFTLTYELDYLNVLDILRLADIPAAAAERGPEHPLILGGGAALTANPRTMEPVFDALYLGELETSGPELFRRLRDGGRHDRDALGNGLSQLWVPSSGRPPAAGYASVADLDRHFAASSIVTPRTVFADTALVELTRGCPRHCAFCLARELYGGARNLSEQAVLQYAARMRPHVDRLGLLGAGISDHPRLEAIAQGAEALGFGVNVSSLRFDRLTPGLLQTLRHSGQRSLTLAPESFSRPIQRFLRKGFALRQVDEGVARVLEAGFERLKYYVMIGVPGEQPDDFEPLFEHLRRWMPRFERAGATLELSFSILEPKPRTELALLTMADRADVKRTERLLRAGLPRSRRLEVQWPSFAETTLTDWLGRGDAEVGRRLLAATADLPRAGAFRLPYREYLDEMDRILGESSHAHGSERVVRRSLEVPAETSD